MKRFILAVVLAVFASSSVLADELKVNVGVEQGTSQTKVVAGDIYALIDGQLVEITIAPDKVPFKMNLKAGALRLKSFWATEKQFTAAE